MEGRHWACALARPRSATTLRRSPSLVCAARRAACLLGLQLFCPSPPPSHFHHASHVLRGVHQVHAQGTCDSNEHRQRRSGAARADPPMRAAHCSDGGCGALVWRLSTLAPLLRVLMRGDPLRCCVAYCCACACACEQKVCECNKPTRSAHPGQSPRHAAPLMWRALTLASAAPLRGRD